MTSILEGTQPPKTRPKFQSKHLSHEKKQPLLLSIESWLVYNRDPYLANTVIPPNQKKNLTNQTRGPFFHCSFSFQPVYLIPMGYGPPRYGKTGLVGAAMGAIAPFAFGRLRRGEDVGGRGGGDVFFPFFFLPPQKIHRVPNKKHSGFLVVRKWRLSWVGILWCFFSMDSMDCFFYFLGNTIQYCH